MKKVLLLVAMIMALAWVGILPAQDNVVRSRASFAPITFSLGCKETTSSINRRIIKRSKNVVGYVKAEECIDISRQVIDAHIIKIAIGEDEKIGNFSVILVLADKDAKSLTALTSNVNHQAMVLSVKGRAVVSSFINEPFQGNQFWITADSIEGARKTADLFNQ
jgi:hypothetical protein